MSYPRATPKALAAAAADLESIRTTLATANGLAAAPTARAPAAGANEISAAVAAPFSGHAQTYQ